MKATSINEYQTKFQPDLSLYLESAWTDIKAPISKKFWYFSFDPCSFQIQWHVRLKFCLVFIYTCSFYLVPKASWAIILVLAAAEPTPTTTHSTGVLGLALYAHKLTCVMIFVGLKCGLIYRPESLQSNETFWCKDSSSDQHNWKLDCGIARPRKKVHFETTFQ
jgi:hypothetical protein